jgi:hypothetical protein
MQELDREKLIAGCGRSIACIKAADYYLQLVKNPCFPPKTKLTYMTRKYLMELFYMYGKPPCIMSRLVLEKLKDTRLADLAEEITDAAVKIKRELNMSSRVAAAVATYLVAQRRNRYVSITSLANIFDVSPSSISNKVREAASVIYNT